MMWLLVPLAGIGGGLLGRWAMRGYWQLHLPYEDRHPTSP